MCVGGGLSETFTGARPPLLQLDAHLLSAIGSLSPEWGRCSAASCTSMSFFVLFLHSISTPPDQIRAAQSGRQHSRARELPEKSCLKQAGDQMFLKSFKQTKKKWNTEASLACRRRPHSSCCRLWIYSFTGKSSISPLRFYSREVNVIISAPSFTTLIWVANARANPTNMSENGIIARYDTPERTSRGLFCCWAANLWTDMSAA